jgi:DNA-directed RNA polymerase I subunit RPA2
MTVLSFNTLTRSDIPTEVNVPLHDLIKPHIDSFNFMINSGLPSAVNNLHSVEAVDGSGKIYTLKFSDPKLGFPVSTLTHQQLLPTHCREQLISYKAPLQIKLDCTVDDNTYSKTFTIGNIPVMVKSDRCNIRDKSIPALIKVGEEPTEFGGYFIINGIEKVVRLLIAPRRNYPMSISRFSFKKKGTFFTKLAVQIRCVRSDASAVTVTLHYLLDGTCVFRFHYMKGEYLVPCVLILKALKNATDKEIYYRANPENADSFIGDRLEGMLRDCLNKGIYTQEHALTYLGLLCCI